MPVVDPPLLDQPLLEADRTVALVHDYLLVLRGAERTFAEMTACWPDAPIYTLLYDHEGTNGRFARRHVVTSGLQRLGVRQQGFRRLLPLFPVAAERLPVEDYDVVVSSSSAYAHGVRPREDAVHVCYCHSPFRYAWFQRERAASEVPAMARPVLDLLLDRTRSWDCRAATRVTHYIANSSITRERIRTYYDRDAGLVHPPVNVARFDCRSTVPHEDWFLIVSELVRHKRVDLALDAARAAGRKVKVVGTGPELERWRVEYADTATFLGRVDDATLDALYPRCAALLMANEEEFGIAAVEAQASGRPVVAIAAGGALETVVDGETGVHVPPDDVDAFAQALRHVDFSRFDAAHCRRNAVRFSADAFRAHLQAEVARAARAQNA